MSLAHAYNSYRVTINHSFRYPVVSSRQPELNGNLCWNPCIFTKTDELVPTTGGRRLWVLRCQVPGSKKSEGTGLTLPLSGGGCAHASFIKCTLLVDGVWKIDELQTGRNTRSMQHVDRMIELCLTIVVSLKIINWFH